MSLRREIFEQPQVLQALLETQWEAAAALVRQLQQYQIRYIFLAARGTSDHAGLYAKYLWGEANRLPIALAAPSLFTLYDTPPRLDGALVVGISQSGQSPDIVSVLAEGRRQGCPTLAITNAPASPLADAAEFVIDIQAGAEKAVAATKTYTAQLMAVAMLSLCLNPDPDLRQALDRVPAWVRQMLDLDDEIARLAARYRFMDTCVVLGRGYNYATAFEWSLKLKELAYVLAEPYSSADFQHGPIATVARGFPVMAVAPQGKVLANMLNLLHGLRVEQKAELLLISDSLDVLELGRSRLQLPPGIPEALTPLVSIVPAQLFCYHLTREKGFDTERPRGLKKVTETE
ncbi:MAG: SIS domain-containing protein [Anaerolineales bacterium]|jgi:glucosamine--fructose-6-phosphate aminotransferase (isomerizing)